jgi:ABC-type amino acid transport substrate-binding protein
MAAVPSSTPGRIFISYRREETAYPAGWLFDRLADHYGGGQVFKDVDSIELGDDFVEVITRAVGSCDVLLALIGEEWLTVTDAHGRRRLDDPDDFVRLEIEAALTRNVRVIPILVDGARMPRADELPDSLVKLVRRQALELSPARFDFDTGRLLKVLDRTLAEVQAQPAKDPRGIAIPPVKPPPGPEPPMAAPKLRTSAPPLAQQPRAAGEERTVPSVALTLHPVVSRGRRSTEHDLTVANPSGQPVAVAVSADGGQELDTEVSPGALRLEANGQATARLRVRPRQRLVAGRARRHGFRAIASVEQTPVAMAEGAMLQPPLASWWLLPVALLAVLGLVALVLRPQPQPLVTIPDPGSASVAEVVALLRQARLTVAVTKEASEIVATGRLIRIAPSAGARVRRGAQVTLFVSSGPKVTPLPPDIRELEVGYVDRFATSKDNPDSLLQGFDPILFPDPKTGKAQGLDVDLMKALGAKLRVTFRFKRLEDFTHSFRVVFERQLRLSMSVLRDLARHQQEVDFIDYLDNGTVLLVPRGNPRAIRSATDLCGRTIVRSLETAAGSILTDSDRCAAQNRQRVSLMTCPTVPGAQNPEAEHVILRDCPPNADPLRLLIAGSADAAMVDAPLVEQAMKKAPTIRQQLQIAPVEMDGGPYGIAIRKGDSELRDALQSALRAIIADGTYDRILAKWNLKSLALRTAAVNNGP